MTENGEWEANARLARIASQRPRGIKKGVPLLQIMF